MSLGIFDIVLVLVVSVMGTALAYLRRPEHKVLVLMLPIPFTLATLCVDRPVDATNVFGLGLLTFYAIGVWALHAKLRLPIVTAIAASALGYCLAGWAVARICPHSGTAFWSAWAGMAIGSPLLAWLLPPRSEPYHRTTLPPWVKLSAIAAIVSMLVLVKHHLGGFLTVFPMVGIVASYEARYSLWTLARRIPWVALTLLPMIATIRLTQDYVGMRTGLAVSWPVLLAALAVATRFMDRDGWNLATEDNDRSSV